MAFLKLSNVSILFVFSLLICVNLVKCNVPVLLWESSSISDKDDLIPALYQLDSDEFSNHVVKKVHQHKPLIVLFLEESLSVEDFSWKDDHGQGSFPQLHNLTSMSAKTEFITSVYDPMAALKDLAESQEYSWVKYDGKKVPKAKTVLEVRLEDPSADEDRPELLRRHDSSISEIYGKLLSQYSHILALFTGKYSSWVEPEYNRVRREVDDNSTISSFNLAKEFADNTYAMISSKSPPVLVSEDGKVNLTNPSGIFVDMQKGSRSIITIFPDKTHLRFKFSSGNGNWKLNSVILNDSLVLKSPMEITRPIGSPFSSDKPIDFVNGTTKLQFQDLQVQSWMVSKVFGDKPPVYFTYPILMGIFVTVILGIILSWAIIMMMDIRTMDRFDDPKGKTITVAQTE